MENFIPNYGPTLGALTCTLHYAKKFNLFWPSGSWENDFYMNPHYFLHLFDFLPIRTWIPFIQGYYVPSFFFFYQIGKVVLEKKMKLLKKKFTILMLTTMDEFLSEKLTQPWAQAS